MPAIVVGAAVGWAAAGATIAGVTITTAAAIAIGVGAAAITQMAMPKVPGGSFANQAYSQQQMVRSPAEPRRGIYGRAMVSGPLVFAEETGTDHKYLHIVIPLAAHRCDAIEEIYFGDDLAYKNGAVQGDYAGNARINVHLGDQTAADADLVAESASWTTAHVGYGVTYVYARLTYDTELYTNGIPNIKALVRGKPVYDPRSDSTAGGSGSHRWDDPSTWAWTDNWALCALDYTRFESGIGALPAEIDLPTFAAAANDSDQLVEYATGQFEPRYTCNGTYTADTSPASVMEKLLTAGAGTHVYVSGKYQLYAGVFQGPAAVELTDDDVMGDIDVRPFTPRAELCNAVRGTFIDPDNFYQATDFPPYESAYYRDQDNGEYIDHDLDLPFTQSTYTAQRLAKLHLELNRNGMQISLPVRMIGAAVAVGRVVSLSIARLALSGDFVVADWQFQFGKPVSLVLNETSPALFDYAMGSYTTRDLVDNVQLPNPSIVAAPANVTWVPFAADDTNLGELSWDAVDSGYTYRVEIVADDFVAYQINTSGTAVAVPHIDSGEYTIKVWAINLYGNRSNNPATLALAVDTAPAVTAIDVVASLFELNITPKTAVSTATSTVFNVKGGLSNNIANATAIGTGKNVIWTNRTADTTYYLWAQTVNDFGISAWFGPVQTKTSGDTTALLDALAEKITADQLAQALLTPIESIPAIQNNIDSINLQLADITGAPDWVQAQAWNAGNLVKNDGSLYRAKQDVPAGTEITDTAYWEYIGEYASLGEAVAGLTVQMTDVQNSVDVIDGKLEANTSRTDTMIAAYRDDDDGEGRLADVLAGWKSKAAIKLEQKTRASAIEAEAQQRLTLSATVNANTAAIQQEQTARANADSALAQDITTLQSSVSGNASAIQQEQTARANADSALAQQIDTVQATANGASAAVQQVSEAQANLDGTVLALTTIKAQTTSNGKKVMAGMVLGSNGETSEALFFVQRFGIISENNDSQIIVPFVIENGLPTMNMALISTLLNKTIIQRWGGSLQVFGVGFGSNSQFIYWFGPDVGDISNCTEANATSYKTVNGNSMTGGSFRAGVLINGYQNTGISPYSIGDYPVSFGPFGTNGRSKTVLLSISAVAPTVQFGTHLDGWSPGTLPKPVFGWAIERKIGSGSWTQIAAGTITGSTVVHQDEIPDTNQYQYYAISSIDGSYTYTDNTASTDNFSYRVRVTAWTSVYSQTARQSIGLTSMES